MKKEDFYTKQKAEAGVKTSLKLEDGTDSGHWLLVRGIDSDTYKKARFDGAKAVQAIPDNAGDWERAQIVDGVVVDTVASLIAGWSFDEPCTPEAARDFLRNAPHIADAVDRTAADRSSFYAKAAAEAKLARK